MEFGSLHALLIHGSSGYCVSLLSCWVNLPGDEWTLSPRPAAVLPGHKQQVWMPEAVPPSFLVTSLNVERNAMESGVGFPSMQV
jgi:hypothetical protein